jgi:KUP system potassium uptake protein
MVVWFLVLAVMGAINIMKAPQILGAINPWYAFAFLNHNWLIAFIALGAVVLAFTGAEALYADMGHFGKEPIRLAWFLIAFPALSVFFHSAPENNPLQTTKRSEEGFAVLLSDLRHLTP